MDPLEDAELNLELESLEGTVQRKEGTPRSPSWCFQVPEVPEDCEINSWLMDEDRPHHVVHAAYHTWCSATSGTAAPQVRAPNTPEQCRAQSRICTLDA